MGTSNWQQISFCVEALMRIEPKRVLDIGVGFGRWGVMTREFCDVWPGRVFRPEWQTHVEGVEAFPKNIDGYHQYFYDQIHVGDLRALLPQFQQRFNLIIFGDVLEHFEKQDARKLLDWSTGLSDYVLVNIPLGEHWEQGEKYENPYEQHLSTWNAVEFEEYYLRRQAAFRDYIDRPHGSFLLSRYDPCQVTEKLFSTYTADAGGTSGVAHKASKRAKVARRLRQRATALSLALHDARRELDTIKRTAGYRVLTRLRRSRLFPLVGRVAEKLLTARDRLLGRPPLESPEPASDWSKPADNWQYIEGDPQNPVVAICHPQWQGVRSAAEGRTPNLLLTPETGYPTTEAIVGRLLETKATHFVADGLYRGYAELLTTLRRRKPDAHIFYVHHGSLFQMLADTTNPARLGDAFRLQRGGVIDRVGVCKWGMADAFRQLGVPVYEVMNRVPQEGAAEARIWRSPAKIFIPTDSQLRKNPHTQLVAALMCDDVEEIHLAGPLDLHYLPKSVLQKVKIKVHEHLDRATTRQLMREADLVMNVSISECAPMVPLEALAAGVPCLTGDNHGLLADFPELADDLVVSREDDVWAIHRAIQHVKQNYAACCGRIQQFNAEYDRKAARSQAVFLGLETWHNAAGLQRAA
jgi:hypothetical protein